MTTEREAANQTARLFFGGGRKRKRVRTKSMCMGFRDGKTCPNQAYRQGWCRRRDHAGESNDAY